MLGYELRDELLLPGERHALHGLIQAQLVLFWHLAGNLVELLLKLLAMLEGMSDHFLFRLFVILLLLLDVHGLHDGFDGRPNLLQLLVGRSELFLAQIFRTLVLLKVNQGVSDRHHLFLLLRE